jgi:hypothetical protein
VVPGRIRVEVVENADSEALLAVVAWSAHQSYTGLIDLGLVTEPILTASLTTPGEIMPVQSVLEAVGTAATASDLEGRR